MMRRAVTTLAVGLLGLGLAVGCSQQSSATVVFAAASLNGLTEALAPVDAEIETSYAGSTSLVAQLNEGAEADVLITANEATMTLAVENDLIIGAVRTLARNRLVMIAAEGVDVSAGLGLAGQDDLIVAVCAPEVPCGALLDEAASELGFSVVPDTQEGDVRAVLQRVVQGEADVGFVYSTDAADATGDVQVIEIAELEDFVTEYQIAATSNTERAEAFIKQALSPTGRQVLIDAGFEVPLS